jgi:hypothetical protein
MNVSRLICGLSALLLCFSFAGCDSGSGPPEVLTNQSELEKFLAENPDVEEGMDTGEEDQSGEDD